MRIKSFGCSFMFGSDLADDGRDGPYATYSHLTWPALIAKEVNAEYSCYARPGAGNLRILERVLIQAASSARDELFIIGWTWIDRFDYTNTEDTWHTILPVDTTPISKTYYRDLHSQYRDKLTTLIYIRTAIDVLNHHKIPFIMTHMDDLIFETKWHATPAITDAQDFIKPYITRFDNKTFLDWSRDKGFEISPTLHPLEEAHLAGADFMLEHVRRCI